MPVPKRLSSQPVAKTCVASVSKPDRQIDAGEDARLRAGAVHRGRNDMGLFEIDDGRRQTTAG